MKYGILRECSIYCAWETKIYRRTVQVFLLKSSPRDSSLAKNNFGGKVHFKPWLIPAAWALLNLYLIAFLRSQLSSIFVKISLAFCLDSISNWAKMLNAHSTTN